MKNITLSADEVLIEAARLRALADHTTLEELFCQWLAEYAQREERMQPYEKVMSRLRGRLEVGCRFSRDEMNER